MTRTLDIVGLGLHVGHLTPQVERLLKRADVVFFLASEPEEARLRELNNELVSWNGLYRPDVGYKEIYRAMVESVLEDRRDRIVVAVEGHPTLFTDGVVPPLVREARAEGRTVSILPAVSAVDAVLADLEFPVGEMGLQILNAASVASGEQPFHSRLGLLLLQPSLADDPEVFEPPPLDDPAIFRRLQDRLLDQYPAHHPLWVVRSRQTWDDGSGLGPGTDSRALVSTVGAFPESARYIDHFSSIFVPPMPWSAPERRCHE